MIIDQTIKSTLLTLAKKLKQNQIEHSNLEADILLAHILKKSREYLFTYPDKKLNKTQFTKLNSLITRRIKGESIAYLTNHKEFYGLDFYVNKNVLVPRPETEVLITNYESLITNYSKNKKSVTTIDVGTGSGCIITTIAKRFNSKFKIQNSKFKLIAIDISKKVLQIAKKNAKLHKIEKNIKFIHGNLLKPILENSSFVIRNSSLVIIANLPYLTPTQIKNSPSIQKEPKLALVAGNDGLKYYKKLFSQIKKLQQTTEANIDVLCEIDPSQTKKIKEMIIKILPNSKIEVKKDLAKKERIIITHH